MKFNLCRAQRADQPGLHIKATLATLQQVAAELTPQGPKVYQGPKLGGTCHEAVLHTALEHFAALKTLLPGWHLFLGPA